MTIKELATHVMEQHELHVMHRNKAAQAAIKAGEYLIKIRSMLPPDVTWTGWIEANLPHLSQRTIYNYIDCYQLSILDPDRAASCSSIRELLGQSLAGKPHRVIDHTKVQRVLLVIATRMMMSADPKLEARALVHAINGTDPKTSAMQPLVADWIHTLQFTSAIR